MPGLRRTGLTIPRSHRGAITRPSPESGLPGRRFVFGLSLLFIIGGLFPLLGQDSPAGPYFVFHSSFGSAGHGDEQLMQPKGMAFSPDGARLAVTDTGNNRVIVFKVTPLAPLAVSNPAASPAGSPTTDPGDPGKDGPKGTTGSSGVSFDDFTFDDGTTVAPEAAGTDSEFSGFQEPPPPAETTGPRPSRSPSPLSVELVMGGIWPWEGSLYPHDPADAYREPDNADGLVPRRELNGRAYHGGQARIRPGNRVPMDRFNLPQGLVWKDPKTIIVCDTGNHRVKAVSLEGEVLWVLGQEGWKDGYFHSPLGIDMDKDGKLYVTEPRSKYIRGLGLDFLQRQRVQGNRLQIFGKDLKVSKRLGHMHHMSGIDRRQLKDPVRVYVSPAGDIHLTDNGNHRVMVYDASLKFKKMYKEWPFYKLRYPFGINGDGAGRLAIADTGNHRVVIVGPDGVIKQILGGFGTQPGRFSFPREARFAPDGSLYVLDSQNCRIQVFRPQASSEDSVKPQ